VENPQKRKDEGKFATKEGGRKGAAYERRKERMLKDYAEEGDRGATAWGWWR